MTKGGDLEGISNKRLVPELRFSEFRESFDWNEDKFCDLFQILSNNTLSRSELSNGKGDVYNIHYGDVLIKFNEYLNVKKEKLPYIKDETKAERYKIAYLKDGDVVMADTAEDETAGKCTEVINVGDAIVVAGLHTIPCRPRKMFARAYLGYYMNSKVFHDRLLPIMQGAKVTSIPKSSLQNIPLVYPQDLEEQQKIAECLSSLDEEISAVKEKVEQLKEHKKGLMQKLFPIAGKFVPGVRFPEFRKDGAWNQEKLSNIARTFSGGTPSVNNKDYYSGDIPFIRSGEINNDTTELFLTHLGVEKSSAKIVEKGTILYALYGATSGEVAISKIKGAINQAILAIIPDVRYSKIYVFQFLKKEKAVIINHFLQGGQGNLSGTIINNLSISFPSYTEQEKIAECLSSIDELISLYEKKVTLLEQHKKGLMQRLFPKL